MPWRVANQKARSPRRSSRVSQSGGEEADTKKKLDSRVRNMKKYAQKQKAGRTMQHISIQIPDDTVAAPHVSLASPERIGSELLLLAATKLFEMGRLSSGAAAKPAGVPRPIFLSKLGEYGVDTFNLAEKELTAEADIAARLR